jgi:hypothetical protein
VVAPGDPLELSVEPTADGAPLDVVEDPDVLVGGVVAPEAPVAGIEGPVAGGVAGAPTVAGMKGNCDIGLLVGELCPLSSPISPDKLFDQLSAFISAPARCRRAVQVVGRIAAVGINVDGHDGQLRLDDVCWFLLSRDSLATEMSAIEAKRELICTDANEPLALMRGRMGRAGIASSARPFSPRPVQSRDARRSMRAR